MTDPRAFSSERLVAPHPLPVVSRRCLKRVENPIPPPTECPCCQGPVRLINNSEIYNGREFGDWPYAYYCKLCDAYVGLHPGTDIPLGTLATKVLREARKSSKTSFTKLYKANKWSRTEAYDWLAKKLDIPRGECHFGWFKEYQCTLAERICENELIVVTRSPLKQNRN